MRKLLCVLMSIALIICVPLSVAAADPDARTITILKNEGTDIKMTKGTEREFAAKEGVRLSDGYTVQTGSDSYSHLKLDEKSIVKLDQKSKVQISRASKTKLSISVLSGAISVDADKQKDGDALEVRAGNSALAVRGTLFTTEYIPSGEFVISMLTGSGEVDGNILVAGSTMFVYDVKENKLHEIKEIKIDGSLSLFTLQTIMANKDELVAGGVFAEEDFTGLPEMIEEKKAEIEAEAEAPVIDPNEGKTYYTGSAITGGNGGGGGSGGNAPVVTSASIVKKDRGSIHRLRNEMEIRDTADISAIQIEISVTNATDEDDVPIPDFSDTLAYTPSLNSMYGATNIQYPVSTYDSTGHLMYLSLPAQVTPPSSDTSQIFGNYTVKVTGSDGRVVTEAVNIQPAVHVSPSKKYSTLEEGIDAASGSAGSQETISIIGSPPFLTDTAMRDGDTLFVPDGTLRLGAKLEGSGPGLFGPSKIDFFSGSSLAKSNAVANPFYWKGGTTPLNPADIAERSFEWDSGIGSSGGWKNMTVARRLSGGSTASYPSFTAVALGAPFTVNSGDVFTIMDDSDSEGIDITVVAGGTLIVPTGAEFTIRNSIVENEGTMVINGTLNISIDAGSSLVGNTGGVINIGAGGVINDYSGVFPSNVVTGPATYSWNNGTGMWE